MVAFRKLVAGSDVNHWLDDGANAIAFSRGAKGFVAINRESATVTPTIATGMAPGTYCDLLTGGRGATGWAGTATVVDATGATALRRAPNPGAAIDTAAAPPRA